MWPASASNPESTLASCAPASLENELLALVVDPPSEDVDEVDDVRVDDDELLVAAASAVDEEELVPPASEEPGGPLFDVEHASIQAVVKALQPLP